MVIQIIKLRSSLSEEEVTKVAHERAELFKEVPGLLQKYYVKTDQSNGYAGVYIWDSMDSIKAFKNSELAATIPAAYKLEGPPDIEILPGIFALREAID